MNILAIESSCDDTAAAVVRDGRTVLSSCVSSQIEMHTIYGGVVPEIASRKHVEAIAALTEKALADAGCTRGDIDAVAVTYAPGLIGAVLVGLSFAKSAALGLGVPLIPVHHIRGHIAANYLAFPELEPPFLALAISGGNTLLIDVAGYTDMKILGGTRDDAAGECFDKAARVLGLSYPGGKPIDELARKSAGGVYHLPHAQVDGAPLDMSFSGLKTAVVNLAHHAQQVGEELDRAALARDFAQAVSQAHRGSGLALARGGGGDSGDQNQLAVGGGSLVEQLVVNLGLVVAVHLQVLLVDAGGGGNLGNALGSMLLGNLNVSHVGGPPAFYKILVVSGAVPGLSLQPIITHNSDGVNHIFFSHWDNYFFS